LAQDCRRTAGIEFMRGTRGAVPLNSSRPLRGSSPRRHRCRWVPCS